MVAVKLTKPNGNSQSGLGSLNDLFFQFKRIPVKFCFAILFGIAVFLYLVSMIRTTPPLVVQLFPNDAVTVLINTFKRHDMMEQSVLYYAKCPLVKQISIVWSESGDPPEALAKTFSKSHSPKVSLFECVNFSVVNVRICYRLHLKGIRLVA